MGLGGWEYFRPNRTWMCLPDFEISNFNIPIFRSISTHQCTYVLATAPNFTQNAPNSWKLDAFVCDENRPMHRRTKIRQTAPKM